MFIVATIVSLIFAVIMGSLFQSFGWGVLSFIGAFIVSSNILVEAMGDWNKATQHHRDAAILDELRKMNDKE